jgi:hypothetical protein
MSNTKILFAPMSRPKKNFRPICQGTTKEQPHIPWIKHGAMMSENRFVLRTHPSPLNFTYWETNFERQLTPPQCPGAAWHLFMQLPRFG